MSSPPCSSLLASRFVSRNLPLSPLSALELAEPRACHTAVNLMTCCFTELRGVPNGPGGRKAGKRDRNGNRAGQSCGGRQKHTRRARLPGHVSLRVVRLRRRGRLRAARAGGGRRAGRRRGGDARGCRRAAVSTARRQRPALALRAVHAAHLPADRAAARRLPSAGSWRATVRPCGFPPASRRRRGDRGVRPVYMTPDDEGFAGGFVTTVPVTRSRCVRQRAFSSSPGYRRMRGRRAHRSMAGRTS